MRKGPPLISGTYLSPQVHGIPEYVITGGRVVVDDCEVKVHQGTGRYVENPPYSPYVYDQVKRVEQERKAREVAVERTPQDMAIDPNSRYMFGPFSTDHVFGLLKCMEDGLDPSLESTKVF